MIDTPTLIQYAGDLFFIATTPSGHAFTIDPKGERKAAPGPLELLIAGVGSCTATDVVMILQKRREQLTEYRLEIRTERRADHPKAFTRIELKHILKGRNLSPAHVERAITLSTDKYCSAVATVRPTAEVVTLFEIHEDESPGAANPPETAA
jgi:putative redox protein